MSEQLADYQACYKVPYDFANKVDAAFGVGSGQVKGQLVYNSRNFRRSGPSLSFAPYSRCLAFVILVSSEYASLQT